MWLQFLLVSIFTLNLLNTSTEHYFHEVLFIAVQGGPIFKVGGWILVSDLQIKLVSNQCFQFMCYVVYDGLTFESVDEALVCDHSNESYRAMLPCGTVYYAVQGDSNFKSGVETLVCDHSNDIFMLYCTFIMLYKVILTQGRSYGDSPFVSLFLSKQPTIFRGENAMTILFDPV